MKILNFRDFMKKIGFQKMTAWMKMIYKEFIFILFILEILKHFQIDVL